MPGHGPVIMRAVGAAAVLTLSRPERLNAVSEGLYETLLQEIRRLGRDPEIRAIVITGEGRAFSVGADLKAHGSKASNGTSESGAEADPTARRSRYVRLGQLANLAIQRCPKPVIAAVNGHAIGGGLELALSCDFLIAAKDAKLRFPEVGLGTFVGGGVTYTLPQRVGALRAKELLLLGRFFCGEEAVALGLANEALDAPSVLHRSLEIAAELAEKAPISMRHAKRLINRHIHGDTGSAMAREADVLLHCMTTSDWREGIDAFAEKRAPQFSGR